MRKINEQFHFSIHHKIVQQFRSASISSRKMNVWYRRPSRNWVDWEMRQKTREMLSEILKVLCRKSRRTELSTLTLASDKLNWSMRSVVKSFNYFRSLKIWEQRKFASRRRKWRMTQSRSFLTSRMAIKWHFTRYKCRLGGGTRVRDTTAAMDSSLTGWWTVKSCCAAIESSKSMGKSWTAVKRTNCRKCVQIQTNVISLW